VPADPSGLWKEVRGWALRGLPRRACNEAWAISKDLRKVTSDLGLLYSKAVADYLTGPIQDSGAIGLIGAAAALDHRLGQLDSGWGGVVLGTAGDADTWGRNEDPLATGWDDVVRHPAVRLLDPLLATEGDAPGSRRATTA